MRLFHQGRGIHRKQRCLPNCVKILLVDYSALYVRSDLTTEYIRHAGGGGRPQIASLDAGLIRPLLELFSTRRRFVFIDEEMVKSSKFAARVSDVLGGESSIQRNDMLLALLVQDSVLGFMVLGPSPSVAYSDVDLLLLQEPLRRRTRALNESTGDGATIQPDGKVGFPRHHGGGAFTRVAQPAGLGKNPQRSPAKESEHLRLDLSSARLCSAM